MKIDFAAQPNFFLFLNISVVFVTSQYISKIDKEETVGKLYAT
jgi:hypothetical protein